MVRRLPALEHVEGEPEATSPATPGPAWNQARWHGREENPGERGFSWKVADFCHPKLRNDGVTSSMDMSLSKLREIVKDGSLACCSPWGCKESDTSELLNNSSNDF